MIFMGPHFPLKWCAQIQSRSTRMVASFIWPRWSKLSEANMERIILCGWTVVINFREELSQANWSVMAKSWTSSSTLSTSMLQQLAITSSTMGQRFWIRTSKTMWRAFFQRIYTQKSDNRWLDFYLTLKDQRSYSWATALKLVWLV